MLSQHHVRRAVAGVAVAIAGIVLVSCGDEQAADDPAGEESTTTSGARDVAGSTTTTVGEPEMATIAVSFADGAVTGGAGTHTVALDEPVRIEVSGDREDEVHVHTYDLVEEVTPGQPAVIEFTADIPGVHEVELEGSHLLLFELQVQP